MTGKHSHRELGRWSGDAMAGEGEAGLQGTLLPTPRVHALLQRLRGTLEARNDLALVTDGIQQVSVNQSLSTEQLTSFVDRLERACALLERASVPAELHAGVRQLGGVCGELVRCGTQVSPVLQCLVELMAVALFEAPHVVASGQISLAQHVERVVEMTGARNAGGERTERPDAWSLVSDHLRRRVREALLERETDRCSAASATAVPVYRIRGVACLLERSAWRHCVEDDAAVVAAAAALADRVLRLYAQAQQRYQHRGTSAALDNTDPSLGNLLPAVVDDIARAACRVIAQLHRDESRPVLWALLCMPEVSHSVTVNAATAWVSLRGDCGARENGTVQDATGAGHPALPLYSRLALARAQLFAATRRGTRFHNADAFDDAAAPPCSSKRPGDIQQGRPVADILDEVLALHLDAAADVHTRTLAVDTLVHGIETTDFAIAAPVLHRLRMRDERACTEQFMAALLQRAERQMEAADRMALVRHWAAELLETPPTRRHRYTGLALLVPVVGARWLLQRRPTLESDTLSVMARHQQHLARPAMHFLQRLWGQAVGEEADYVERVAAPTVLRSVRRLWDDGMRHPLQGQLNAAQTLVNYAAPALFRSGMSLRVLQSWLDGLGVSGAEHVPNALDEAVTLAVAAVAVQCGRIRRVHIVEGTGGSATGCVTEDASTTLRLHREVLLRALLAEEDTLALNALQLLTRPSASTTAHVDEAVLALLHETAPWLLKGRIHEKYVRIIEQFMDTHLTPSWAAARRMHHEAMPGAAVAAAHYAERVGRYFQRWIGQLVSQLCPGAHPERQWSALRLLQVVPADAWEWMAAREPPSERHLREACGWAALGASMDPFDRVRAAALPVARAHLWCRMDGDTRAARCEAAALAWPLMRSRRPRDADAGVRILRCVLCAPEEGEHATEALSTGGGDTFPDGLPPLRAEALAKWLVQQLQQQQLLLRREHVHHGYVLLLRQLLSEYPEWRSLHARNAPLNIPQLIGLCERLVERWFLGGGGGGGHGGALRTGGGSSARVRVLAREGLVRAELMEAGDDEDASGSEAGTDKPMAMHNVFLVLKETMYLAAEVASWLCATRGESAAVAEAASLSAPEWEAQRLAQCISSVLLGTAHNGVCSHAAQAWFRLCTTLSRCAHEAVRAVPRAMLHDTIARVSVSDSMYALRRSAGVPLFICGALAADERAPLAAVLRQLLQIGRQRQTHSEVAVVHALNLIKALLTDTRLRQRLPPFAITEGVLLALEGMQSNWMVRNASLQVFAACAMHLLGAAPQTPDAAADDDPADAPPTTEAVWNASLLTVRRDTLSVETFLVRYAALVEPMRVVLQREVRGAHGASVAAGAVLSLLANVSPTIEVDSRAEDGDAQHVGLRVRLLDDLLHCCTRSASYVVRKRAALAWSIFAGADRPPSWLLRWDGRTDSPNAAHGKVWCWRALWRLTSPHAAAVLAAARALSAAEVYGDFGAVVCAEWMQLLVEAAVPCTALHAAFCRRVIADADASRPGAVLLASIATQWLYRWGDEREADALVAELGTHLRVHPMYEVRAMAAMAATPLPPDSPAVEALQLTMLSQLEREPNVTVQCHLTSAVGALAPRGDSRAIFALAALAQRTRTLSVHNACTMALGRLLCARHAPNECAEHLWGQLRPRASEGASSWSVRLAVARSLLTAVRTPCHVAECNRAPDALPASLLLLVLHLLEDDDEAVRRVAAHGAHALLGCRGPVVRSTAALPVLCRALLSTPLAEHARRLLLSLSGAAHGRHDDWMWWGVFGATQWATNVEDDGERDVDDGISASSHDEVIFVADALCNLWSEPLLTRQWLARAAFSTATPAVTQSYDRRERSTLYTEAAQLIDQARAWLEREALLDASPRPGVRRARAYLGRLHAPRHFTAVAQMLLTAWCLRQSGQTPLTLVRPWVELLGQVALPLMLERARQAILQEPRECDARGGVPPTDTSADGRLTDDGPFWASDDPTSPVQDRLHSQE